MSCGCNSPCGCTVVGVGYVSVTKEGDTFLVGVDMPIKQVADTDCIVLAVDGITRTLTAEPVLALAADHDASVELTCTEDGLVGDVIVDPASTAIVSTGPDGLRVDMPPAELGDGEGRPGDYLFFAGIGARVGYVDADGSELQRSEYSSLHDALSLAAVAASWTNGSDLIDGLAKASLLSVGLVIEAAGFVPGSTITEILSNSQIRVSTNAVADGPGELRVYPYGDGDGFSTFNLPDLNERLPLGFDHTAGIGSTAGIGFLGGDLEATLIEANLPPHSHVGSIIGGISVSTVLAGALNVDFTADGTTNGEPNHTHQTATPNRSFVEVNPSGITTVHVKGGAHSTTGDDVRVVVGYDPNPDVNHSVGDLTQLNDGGTGPNGAHSHTASVDGVITGADIAAALSVTSTVTDTLDVTIGNGAGTSAPVSLPLPPHVVGRWMVHT